MENEHTQYFYKPQIAGGSDLSVTVFDGPREPRTYRLLDFGTAAVTFGRNPECNIVLESGFVSRPHGVFTLWNGVWYIEDSKSSNGTYLNRMQITQAVLRDGDVINIYDAGNNAQGVLMVVSASDGVKWEHAQLRTDAVTTVGRDENCDITLPHVSVSKRHAAFSFDGQTCRVQDLNSTNGTYVNGDPVRGEVELREKDVVYIANAKLIYCNGGISYSMQRSGIRVEAQDIVKAVTKKRKIICNHVSLTVNPGELIAIIGGSGAGKSTIMNCISGYSIPTEGRVLVNGQDLYRHYNALKSIIGYVPQQDIVYDELTVKSMLEYAAKLRLPADTSGEEIAHIIERVLEMVELSDRKDTLIRSLSGGQKKRASIAVELLSDPKLFFLDEPVSGLDPGTERNLMRTLKKMSGAGKTVIMVTHSTLSLKMFDKIVFMGKGGNLCYYGSHDDACAFFGVDDIVDVYNKISDEPEYWARQYLMQQSRRPAAPAGNRQVPLKKGGERSAFTQLAVLSRRYLNLIVNDRTRLMIMLGLPPVLLFLVSMVKGDGGQQFIQFEITQALLFSFACCAYFIGTLNSIQEICKERNILRREYMTGLKLTAYIGSKVGVLAIICLVQSLLETTIFFVLVGSPEEGLITKPFLEFLITVYLTSWASSIMGIFVSALVKNADRAMSLAPLLLMPQLLFAGVIFDLKGVTEVISWFAVCRWSMEAMGSCANLNSMEHRLIQELDDEMLKTKMAEQFTDKEMFEFTQNHVLMCWLILLGFVVVFSVAAGLVLSRIKNERK